MSAYVCIVLSFKRMAVENAKAWHNQLLINFFGQLRNLFILRMFQAKINHCCCGILTAIKYKLIVVSWK